METMESAVIEHRHHGHMQFFVVWGGLLLITGIEVFLAYQHLQPLRMLTILLGLSIIKAALIISYFMHLKFETRRMRVLLMASLIACLSLMSTFFADAFRILSMGVR